MIPTFTRDGLGAAYVLLLNINPPYHNLATNYALLDRRNPHHVICWKCHNPQFHRGGPKSMSILPYAAATGKWASAKAASLTVSDKLAQLGPHYAGRAARMADCSNQISYWYCKDCGSLKIARTNLCRDRLCPICAWRLALQRTGEMMAVTDYLVRQRPTLTAAMLTLTVKNCNPAELKATVEGILRAWGLLMKRRPFQRWVSGYARSIEITPGTGGTYHPHIHALLIFKDGYKKDISQREWAEMWRESLGVAYTPIVDIRRAYTAEIQAQEASATDDAWRKLMAATVEACKYALKGSTTTAASPEELRILATAIGSKMLISYGGSIRAARQALGINGRGDNPTNIEDTTIECPKCGSESLIKLVYEWAAGQYLLYPLPV